MQFALRVCNVGDERIDSLFCPVSTSLRCNLWWRSSRRPYRRGREGERERHTHSPKYRLGPRAKPPSFAFSRLPSLTSSMEAVGFCSIRHCALEQQTSSSCGLSVADFGSFFPLKQRTLFQHRFLSQLAFSVFHLYWVFYMEMDNKKKMWNIKLWKKTLLKLSMLCERNGGIKVCYWFPTSFSGDGVAACPLCEISKEESESILKMLRGERERASWTRSFRSQSQKWIFL